MLPDVTIPPPEQYEVIDHEEAHTAEGLKPGWETELIQCKSDTQT